MELTEKQQLAISNCTDVTKRVVAVTGPAGSGKTTIIKMVYAELLQIARDGGSTVKCIDTTVKRRPVLCAPTGRAARRISEATGIPAVTLHKLLGFGKPTISKEGIPSDTYAAYHKDNVLFYTDVIVDEYAMVNEELHRSLVDALPRGGRLLAFGDLNQLPPIEPHELADPTSPFERLLALPNSVALNKVFRQGEESGIIRNASRVLSGSFCSRFSDFDLKITDSPILVLRSHLRDGGIDYMELANQIIVTGRKGPIGTVALNQVVQSYYMNRLGEDGIELTRHDWQSKDKDGRDIHLFVHVGDKIICNENTYDLRDFFSRFQKMKDTDTPVWSSYVPPNEDQQMLNGEIGIVTEILDDRLTINFGDRYVDVPFIYREWNPKSGMVYLVDPRKRLDLGYVVTTHKMQGSECNRVCFITHAVARYNLNRNNLYTAITRARESVVYIADQRTWKNGPALTARKQQELYAQIAREERRTKSTKKTEIKR